MMIDHCFAQEGDAADAIDDPDEHVNTRFRSCCK